MELTNDIRKYIEKSILCWVATVSKDGIPNVSPKEIFKLYNEKIIIANIASPQTVKNLQINENVCISFIDVLIQKGYQLKGKGHIIDQKNPNFTELEHELLKITGGNFPFSTITEIEITSSKPIIAPRYLLYPNTTEAEQIEQAKKVYGIS